MAGLINLRLLTDFFNKIGQERRFCHRSNQTPPSAPNNPRSLVREQRASTDRENR